MKVTKDDFDKAKEKVLYLKKGDIPEGLYIWLFVGLLAFWNFCFGNFYVMIWGCENVKSDFFCWFCFYSTMFEYKYIKYYHTNTLNKLSIKDHKIKSKSKSI